MTGTVGGVVARDAIRAYLIELRKRRGETQQTVGERAGVTRLAWRDYEAGKTKDPAMSVILEALRYLRGSFDDLRELASNTATPAQGVELAEMRAAQLNASSAVKALKKTMGTDEFREYVRELRENARAQQDLLDLLDE